MTADGSFSLPLGATVRTCAPVQEADPEKPTRGKDFARALPDFERLRHLLDYDPRSGALSWRVSRGVARAGQSAMLTKTRDGLCGGIDGVKYRTHRVIWKWVYGVEPLHIDHIDGNPFNNRLVNLRSVTSQVNHQNRRLNSNNTSGHLGVYHLRSGKWKAVLWVGGEQIFLGKFKTKEEAAAARKGAQKAAGFHENHGRRKSTIDQESEA